MSCAEKKIKQRLSEAVLVLIVFTVWTMLYLVGYPRPHVDDLFFAGAGVSIAQGGGLTNPWLQPFLAQFGTDKYYVQTTFQPYLLGLWLKVFDISTSSVLAFQCLAAATGSAFLLLALKRVGFSLGMLAVVLLLYVAFVVSAGLRPEVLGLAFVSAAALVWRSESRAAGLAGCFLAACAPLFTPFLYTLVLPLGLSWLLGLYPVHRGWERLWTRASMAVAAAVVAFFLLLWSVHFEFGEYLRVMSQHAAGRVPELADKLQVFWANYTVGYEVLFRTPAVVLPWLFFALSWWSAGRSVRAMKCAWLAFGLAAFVTLGVLGYTQQLVKYLPTVSVIAAGVVVACMAAGKLRQLLRGAWFFVAGLLLFPWVASQVFQFPMFQQLYPKQQITQVRVAVAISGKRLFLDEFAVRYFYDFNPPAGSLDWLHCRQQDAAHRALLKDKPEDVSWLVNARKAHLYAPDAGVELDALRMFGRTFSNFSRNQFEVLYFP